MTRPVEERFHEKYEQGDGCWEWTAHRNPVTGYGMLNVGGTPKQAHRLALELRGAEIPDGHQVHHRCENRGCVNPAHLEVVTPYIHSLRHPQEKWSVCLSGRHDLTEPKNVIQTGAGRRCRHCWNERRRENRAKKRELTDGRTAA